MGIDADSMAKFVQDRTGVVVTNLFIYILVFGIKKGFQACLYEETSQNSILAFIDSFENKLERLNGVFLKIFFRFVCSVRQAMPRLWWCFC